jgi:predicted transposase/invertase (TIGR01784 family)
MEEKNIHPHDDFFKVAFSRLDIITDYIHQFLDRNIVEKLDFQTLKLSNNSYTTEGLQSYFADIVWECNYGTAQTPIKISVLFEHKSYIPKYPHTQLLRYMLEIWDDCEKNKKPLTPIIPIIVYHNKHDKHWKYKPFHAYFKGIDASLQHFIPSFEYQLTDLTTMSDEQLLSMKAGLLINALLTLQFGAKEKYVLENFKMLLVNVKNTATDEHLKSFFIAQLVYVLKNNELSDEKVSSIIDNFKNTIEMNAYDRLIGQAKQEGKQEGWQEGKQAGKQEGWQEGKQAGWQEGKQEIIKNMLTEFPDWSDEKIADLANASIDTVSMIRAELKK